MMRRGHPGIGGWRNENPRHFRPRGGIPPHFRPPRNYPPLDIVRFPPPSVRPHRAPRPYNIHTIPVSDGHSRPEHHERNKYRFINPQSNQLRHQDRSHNKDHRHHYMSAQRTRHSDVSDHSNTYKDTSNYYENTNQIEQYCVNNMGDVDHRQYFNVNQNQESDQGFKQHQTSNWSKSLSDTKKNNFDDRSFLNKHFRHDSNEQNKIPVLDYTGHRPPASDHYGGNPSPALDNSNTFSRSVDDTVNLIRKRLLNRNESQHLSEEHSNEQSHNEKKNANETTGNKYQNVQQEQPIKRRLQRQKQSANSNCDKMKNKIVHQLFKMDKDKIHKLMDNPNSSTKFEYAINSLITESRNSFNRHLRSVAEKSLCSSSSEFIHNDNNTIYEDTFMKEMQCILDPQDTVLLEDIKPIVMAELTKVLQLDDVEQIYELVDESPACNSRDEQTNYPQYANESYDYNDYTQSNTYYPDSKHDIYQSSTMSERIENTTTSDEINRDYEYDPKVEYGESKPLFKRRPTRKSSDYSQDTRSSTDSQHQSVNSVDNKLSEEIFNNSDTTLPFFESNAEQLSEEEDPFAELDNQYHVAVDHNFIETDDISTLRHTNSSNKSAPVNEVNCNLQSPDENLHNIKNEIDSQLQSIAKTPLKLCSIINNENKEELEQKSLQLLDIQVKQEVTQSFDYSKDNLPSAITSPNNVVVTVDNDNIMQEYNIESKEKEVKKCENSNITEKSSIPSNARKRSIDQRPSHRKEKRKKSESNQIETNKQILNKNIIINVNDCAAKASEKCDAPKSIFNLYFSKNTTDKDTTNENKKLCSTDKQYSDKYVKRKESQKRPKEKESDTKRKNTNNDTSSHSILSPNNNSNTSTGSQTPNKTEAKKKLQTIDMFVEQPRKINIHQAHRNTASTPNVTNKNLEDKKIKTGAHTISKLNKKHIATQVVKKTMSKETQTFESKSSTTRFCQTELKNFTVKAVQTDVVFFEKTGSKSIDAFERMKEIDMEIQMLLQEKFKLYNSLESKDSCPNTMQTLGMTVLNVAPFEETRENEVSTETVLSEDVIVEDFTSIPVEELEQIAFESVEEVPSEPPKVETRNRRQKIIEKDRKSSESPKPSTKKGTKKAKTPNISLIEQIITDDRPLEDIISLDDLEVSPIKTRRTQRLQNRPKRKLIKKIKQMKPLYSNLNFEIKECSVVVVREDFSKLFRAKSEEPIVIEELVPEQEENIVVEPLINDIQFDMLDVSEDIVIDDNCEVKSLSDKDVTERIDVPVNEEIILDNSQSSSEEVVGTDVSRDIVCKIYDYTADEHLKRDSVAITGHGDAVLAIECIENNFIVACLDGNVYYFNGDGQLITTLRGSNLAVTCLTIVKEKYGTTVYTGSLDSRIRYFDLETGLEKGPECNVLSPIQSMDRAWDTVFVGTRTGFVLQFECKNNMLIPVSTVKFSEQSILALRAMKEGPRKVLLVAARSDNVTIKDAQTGLLLRTLVGPKMTVYSLLYEDGKVYCGTSSHQIHVFDYTSGSHVGTHEGGKGAVCLRATGGLLFAGCYDGCVYVYREGESRPFAQLRGPGPMLLSLVIVGSKIIAGYKDRSLYIWKIPLSILKEMIL